MNKISITSHDVSTMCRLCLSNGNAEIDIFMFSKSLKHQVADVIMKAAPVQIKRCDEMPNFICQLCHTQLETSHKFQMQILQSEKTLRCYLQELHASDTQIKSERSIQTPYIHNIDPDIAVKCEYLKLPDVPTNYNPVNETSEKIFLKSEIKDESLDDNLPSSTESAENLFKADCTKISYENNIDDIETISSACDDITIVGKGTNIDTSENVEFRRSADVTNYLGKCKEITKNISKNKTKEMKLNQLTKKKPKRTNEKPYQCDVCNISYQVLRSLRRHQRIHISESKHNIHTVEKPYQCDICNKRFIQQGILNIHKRTHTGEKLYRCDICDKRFSTSGTLNRHQRIHTDEKPYPCDVCNMSFKELHYLKRHQRMHTGEKPHQCDVCKKRFSESCNLNVHKRTHTGEKPYQCDWCSKCYSVSSHLSVHKRIHTGEKPYQCDVCNKCFSNLRKLKTHKRQHT